jgi:hypothetical protein
MEGAVEAEARIDVAREIVRRGNDRLESRPDEGVAMSLAAGERSGVAPKERKMRREFLAKRHVRYHSCSNPRVY